MHRNRMSRWGASALGATLLVGLVAGVGTTAHAAEVTDSIPLSEIGDGPVSVELASGVVASVNVGQWYGSQGYTTSPEWGPQTWTFSEPVSLRFSMAGLNWSGECAELPAGVVVESIHPDHVWDAATRQVCWTAAGNPAAESVFVLEGPVTEFTWTAPPGGAAHHGRGPTFIEVTVDRDPAVLVDDADSTVVDTPKVVEIQGNDSIPDGSTGWDVDSTTTEGGTVVDNGDGTVTYTPPAGFTGTDTFTYRVTGPDGVEVEATVTVTVTEDPDAGVPLVAGGLAVAGLLGLGGIGAARSLRRRS
ncbi:Ig-like domain-containing protein [Oerskovia flava]|uniref:Ig-like domain-containing protein n=1 Tax=Oerskovia flava TaxID=2986422 RepID=UPI002240BCBC|nr:Ig-like domain-containing protein [Oerskovia sp. JB1-3-2]